MMHYILLINGQGFSVKLGKQLMDNSCYFVNHYWNELEDSRRIYGQASNRSL